MRPCYVTNYNSPLGEILLASDGDVLTGLWFVGQKHFGTTLSPAYEQRESTVFVETRAWLDRYFAGKD